MDTLDFLTPDTEQIRHQIFNILDSYSHEWDVLAELTQNAIALDKIEAQLHGLRKCLILLV